MAVLRHQRPLRPAGGPAAAVLPARRRGPGRVHGRLRARRVRALRDGRRGPREHRQHGPPPEPERVRDPRGAGPPAGDPAPDPGHPIARRPARRGPARLCRARPRAPRRRGAVRVPARQRLAQAARRDRVRGRRGGPVQHRPLLRHRARPVRAPRRRPGGLLRPPPPDADPGRRRPAHGRHRSRRGRRGGDDRAQGEGPRVPGRVPAGAGDRPVPGHRAAGAAGPAGRAGQRDAARGRLPAAGGAPPVLRGHDAGPGRAGPLARRRLRRPAGAACLAVRPRGAGPAGGGRGDGQRGCVHHPARAPGRQPAAGTLAGGPTVPGRGAAAALVLRGGRLPDLPAQVQVRPRPAGAAGAPPLADLRLGAPRRRLGVPQAPCPRRRHVGGRPGRLVRRRLAVRGVPVARARGGTPRCRARVPAPVPRGAAASRGDHPGLRGAGVQLPAGRRPGPRPVRPGGHHPARRGRRRRCLRPPTTMPPRTSSSP